MRTAIVVLAAILALGGCATGASNDAAGAASPAPAPDLVGTWRGTAFAVPGSNYGVSTPVELTIAPDGSWSWSKRGQRQAAGRGRIHRDLVLVEEAGAGTRNIQAMSLKRRGDHLWGVSPAFIPGWMSAVDLQRGPES